MAITAEQKTREQGRKISLIAAKGDKCENCGVKSDDINACIFQFHQLDPQKKEFALGSAVFDNVEDVKDELDKTIMACSNCHCKIHSERY